MATFVRTVSASLCSLATALAVGVMAAAPAAFADELPPVSEIPQFPEVTATPPNSQQIELAKGHTCKPNVLYPGSDPRGHWRCSGNVARWQWCAKRHEIDGYGDRLWFSYSQQRCDQPQDVPEYR